MSVNLETPTGCLTSSFGNAASFQFREDSKSTIFELTRTGVWGTLLTEDFTSGTFFSGWRNPDWYPEMSSDGFPGIIWSANRVFIRSGGSGNMVGWRNISLGRIVDAEVVIQLHRTNTGASKVFIRMDRSAKTFYKFGMRYNNGRFEITKVVDGVETVLIFGAGSTNNTWYWIRAYCVGTALKLKWWTGVIGAEPGGWNLEITDATLTDGYIGIGGRNQTSGGHQSRIDNLTIEGNAYPATSPVRYGVWDSALKNSIWASSVVIVKTNVGLSDSGTVKVKEAYSNILYGAGDEVLVDAIASATWLTPNASDEVTLAGGRGQYRYLLFQFVSDGSQQTSLAIYDEGQLVTISTDGGNISFPCAKLR